jgi:hypothetical protein
LRIFVPWRKLFGPHRHAISRDEDAPPEPASPFAVTLWRAGLRIQEALALAEAGLDHGLKRSPRPSRQKRTPPRSRHGRTLLGRATAGARAASRAARRSAVLRHQRSDAASRRRRHASRPAPDAAGSRCPPVLRGARSDTPTLSKMPREGVPLIVIQRQLGQRNLGITSTCKASTTPESSRSSTPLDAGGPP